MTFPGDAHQAPLPEDERFVPDYLMASEDDTFYLPPADHAPASTPAPVVEELDDQERMAHAVARVTSAGLTEMSPAERIAALTAIRDAVDHRIGWEKATVIENLTGAKESTSIPTGLGNLTFKPSTLPTKIDEDKLLAYVKEHHPDMVSEQVIEVIDPEFRKLLVSAVVHVGDGDFALSTDGTEINFAYLGDPTTAQIAYPASREQKIVKLMARKALEDQFTALTSQMSDAVKGITP